MISGNLAAIDLGTNSCRLKITNAEGVLLYRDSVATKLGEGLHGSGKFSVAAIERGLNCLSQYAAELKKFEVTRYRAVATASCRMAANGADFVKEVENKTGIKLEIISPREEAELNVKGAALNASPDAEYIVVYDLGGGSTEISLAENNAEKNILYSISMPWGARNAAEAFDLAVYNEEKAARLRSTATEYALKFVNEAGFNKYKQQCECIATSSTALRLANMVCATGCYNRDYADGLTINIAQTDEQIVRVYSMSFAEMAESAYIGKNRAEVFVAACIIFKSVYDALGIDVLTTSLKGALEAILIGLREHG